VLSRGPVIGLALTGRTDLVTHKKAAAIAEIENVRDQLVVMRERLFQLSAATAARTKKVEGLLIDCGGAARVFGAPIGLPDWNNVLATPGRQSAHSLDEELREEMQRVTDTICWNSPEQPLDRTNNDFSSLREIVRTLDAWMRRRPAPKRTLRHIVLERLEEAGAKGSKGIVKANKYRPFSASKLAERGGNSRAKTVELHGVPARKQAV
jgi:hypothetical protein